MEIFNSQIMKIKTIKNTKLNTIGLLGLSCSLLLQLSSCKKGFLDQVQDPKIVKITANSCRAILDNYDVMNNVAYPNGGEISSDDYYSPFQVSTDMGADQMLYRWDPKAQYLGPGSANSWLTPYQVVYYANVVLETLEQSPSNLDQATINDLKGEALFFRANMFYGLAQNFTASYDAATADQDLGIPVRTAAAIEVESSRGTVTQTFTQIITDLKQAIDLLPLNSQINSRPNKASAYAALARVYLSMQDFVNAGKCADASLSINNKLMDYNTFDVTSTSPFSRDNAEVLFTCGLYPTILGKPRKSAYVDTTLYKSYDDNDLRKSLFFKTINNDHYFTGHYNQASGTAKYFNGYATDEEYLIRAECSARAGKTADALTDLNTLLKTRWKNTVPYPVLTAASADDALKLILTERRKELCFRGIRWADLRRLNKDPRFAKTLIRGSFTDDKNKTFTLPPNDKRYALLLPEFALQNNTFQQNPR
jgi:tetratricopeptide (TPR) repeat protein